MSILIAGILCSLLCSAATSAETWIEYRNGSPGPRPAPRGYDPRYQGYQPYQPYQGYPAYRGDDRGRDSRREFRREQERYGDDRRRDRRWRADDRYRDDGRHPGGFVTRQERAPQRYPPPAYGPYSAPAYPQYPYGYDGGYHEDDDDRSGWPDPNRR